MLLSLAAETVYNSFLVVLFCGLSEAASCFELNLSPLVSLHSQRQLTSYSIPGPISLQASAGEEEKRISAKTRSGHQLTKITCQNGNLNPKI